MVWLIIDCAQRSSIKRLIPAEDLEKLHNSFRAGDYVGAYQGTLENNSVINNVARVGLVTVGDGKSATEHALAESIISEQAKISNRNINPAINTQSYTVRCMVGTPALYKFR